MEQSPLPVAAKTVYAPEIQEVHDSFNSYETKVLDQAAKLNAESTLLTAPKVNLLKKLGFHNVPQVQEFDRKQQEKKLANTEKSIIAYYKRKYVLYKYISEGGVRDICKKYNLVAGQLLDFTGFVPEKNLKEIDNFVIDAIDVDFEHGQLKFRSPGAVNGLHYLYDTDPELATAYFGNDLRFQRIGNSDMVFTNTNWSATNSDEIIGNTPKADNSKIPFQIVAPLDQMQVRPGYEIQDGRIVYDPVVLAPVNKGGYLIVTAWGDEAADPLVANSEIHN